MKTVFRKAWLNAKSQKNQVSVQFHNETQQEVSANLRFQGVTGTSVRTHIQTMRRDVFESIFPGYKLENAQGVAIDEKDAVVVNQECNTLFGQAFKIVYDFTTDSTKAARDYYQAVNRPDGTPVTSGGAQVYRKSAIVFDMDAKDTNKPEYDTVAAAATA